MEESRAVTDAACLRTFGADKAVEYLKLKEFIAITELHDDKALT